MSGDTGPHHKLCHPVPAAAGLPGVSLGAPALPYPGLLQSNQAYPKNECVLFPTVLSAPTHYYMEIILGSSRVLVCSCHDTQRKNKTQESSLGKVAYPPYVHRSLKENHNPYPKPVVAEKGKECGPISKPSISLQSGVPCL